jgi:multicomponent Na+:H+ antiporter subunit D
MAAGNPVALLGAFFHLFNHGAFKGLLFLTAGSTEYATGLRNLNKLGGVNNRMPVTGLSATVGALSTAGVPPFNGFWSKLLIIIGLVEAHMYGAATIAVAVSILTLWYFLILQRKVFFGKLREGLETVREAPFLMTFATACLAAICLATGLFYPWVVSNLIAPAVDSLIGGIQIPPLAMSGGIPWMH